MYNKPEIDEIRDSPAKVVAAIDDYARTKKYLMNVGEDKGKIVCDLIKEVKPQIMVECGGYVGYSAVLFGEALRAVGGKRYWVFERDPVFAAITSSLVDLAGLGDLVKVVVAASDASIRRLHASGELKHIDMMFIDHYKPAYLIDLKLSEELKLVGPGSVMAADNVIKPGNPPYLEYVRSTCDQKREAAKGKSANGFGERFPDWAADQYKTRQGQEKLNEALIGNPNLVYDSKIIHSWEPSGVPDGVEITRCTGEES